MMIDVISNSLFQFGDAAKDDITNAVVCEITKPAFNHIQPGIAGGCEMHMKASMPLQPSLDH